jgi:uncharacterized membrane protein
MKFILIIIVIVIAVIYFTHLANKAKRKRLMHIYNDFSLVERLMEGQFWQGQTTNQLIDSIGKPDDISRQVLKSKTKETWKYQKTGNKRYALKIFVEDGIVVGWDQK